MKPKTKPQRPLSWLENIIKKYAKTIGDEAVVLIGIRGYYQDSMGKKGVNDRGIYDDAAFWINLKTGFLATYNFNTDPSGYRKGKGTGSTKGMASLNNGIWRYKPGIHYGTKPHPAFRQHKPVTVTRDGTPDYEDTGMFGINIHMGGDASTSSLGCQTVPPSQWPDFKATGDKLLKNAGQKEFNYILVSQQG